jgi:hypothetical protein
MSLQPDRMEHLLTELGRAHREGAFSAPAREFPWRTAEPEAPRFTHRRFAWIRVAAPLAAAAAIAIVFAGPSLRKPQAAHEVADNAVANDRSIKPEQPVVEKEAVTRTTQKALDCDYNGDGVVDGNDIQAFVNRLKDIEGDPQLEVEYLQRCLLGQ